MNYASRTYVQHAIQCLILAIVGSLYFSLPVLDLVLATLIASIALQYLGFAWGTGQTQATIAETETYAEGFQPPRRTTSWS